MNFFVFVQIYFAEYFCSLNICTCSCVFFVRSRKKSRKWIELKFTKIGHDFFLHVLYIRYHVMGFLTLLLLLKGFKIWMYSHLISYLLLYELRGLLLWCRNSINTHLQENNRSRRPLMCYRYTHGESLVSPPSGVYQGKSSKM